MTIYALLVCVFYPHAQVMSTCLPTPYMNELSAEACEMRRRYFVSVRPDVITPDMKMRSVCVKKNVATWEPVEAPAPKPKAPVARQSERIASADPSMTPRPTVSPATPIRPITPPNKELRPIDRINMYGWLNWDPE